MSNKNVNTVRRVRRTIITVIAICAAMLTLLTASVLTRQRILRYRAERLLSDVRNLKLRTGTWSDAQDIFRRWGAWGRYDGTCTRDACRYQIELSDDFTNLIDHWHWPGLASLKIYELFGGRPTTITAYLTIAHGQVWGKVFDLKISVPPRRGPNEPFGGNGYWLIGTSRSVLRFAYKWPGTALHGDYAVYTPGACSVCRQVIAEFTPYADPADVQRLMDIDLSCITRRRPCRDPGEIMPAAWKQYEAEQENAITP